MGVGKDATEEEIKMIYDIAAVLVKMIDAIDDIAIEEQVVYNIVANHMMRRTKITSKSLDEEFKSFATHLTDEILLGCKMIKSSGVNMVKVDRKVDI